MKTFMPLPADVQKNHKWFVIDAAGQTLGRVCTLAAMVLRGKHKPDFVPHIPTGDFVIIVNAGKVKVSGKKLTQKIYYRHTEFPGGIKTDSLAQLLETKPNRAFEIAIKGMLPKNHTGHLLMTRLRVYNDGAHPHQAQNPQPLTVRA